MFDLGLTLVEHPREDDLRRVLAEFQVEVDAERLRTAFYRVDQNFMKDKPGVLAEPVESFFAEYMRDMFVELGLARPDPAVVAERVLQVFPPRRAWQPFPETVDVLRALRRQGYPLGLVSNWDLTARATLSMLELDHFFDSVVISSECGASKPDRRIFLKCVGELGVEPSETYYVGDNVVDDVEGAKAAGLKPILVDRVAPEERLHLGVPVISNLWQIFDVVGVLAETKEDSQRA